MITAEHAAIRQPMASPKKFWPALSLILVTGLLLRLPNLNESLWFDEIWSTHVMLPNLSALYWVSLEDQHPPFYQVFMFGWIRLFGDSELSVRMPSLLFGLSSICLVYALASRVVERKTALLASLLVAASPVHIWYSQEARSYSSLLFFLLLSLVAYLNLKGPSPRWIWFFVYFGALSACSLTHFYLSIYVVLISMICILGRHQQKKFILAVNFVILVCVAAWIITRVVLTGVNPAGGYLVAFTFGKLWELFFSWFSFGNSWGKGGGDWKMLCAQLFFLVIFVYGLTLILFQQKPEEIDSARNVVWYLFALPVFLLVVSSFGFKGYIERSVFVALPFFYIVIAKGVIGIGTLVPQRPGSFGRTFVKALGGGCILIVIALNIVTLKEYFSRGEEWTVYKPNPDWRSAAPYLGSEINSSSEQLNLPIFAVNPPLELSYYNSRFIYVQLGSGQDVLQGEDAQRYWVVYVIGPDYMKNFHDALFKTGAQAFHLIHNKYWGGHFHAVFKTLMEDRRLQYRNMQSFKGINIYRFTLRTDGD